MSAISAYRNSNMNLQKWAAALGGVAVLILSLTPTANAKPIPAKATICSPVKGQWYFGGKPGPIITQTGDQLSVDMSAYGRPVAKGTVTPPSAAKVNFPDDGTFGATLVSPSCIEWTNTTIWTK
ncbi:MAG: hypothetical protein H9534_23580 [Dolichospermum circinale Clear-D4]|nr:hypothetical protein [Dolichospermum circinale Clear-D4]